MTQNTSHAVMAQRHEEWRSIPSFPAYEASSFGQIRRGSRILKASPNRRGYLQLNISQDGKIFCRRVHTLVCEAFRGPKPEWANVAAHGDGDLTNNCENNLRWATYTENSEDMVEHGTRLAGENHPRALLSQAQVDAIRREHADSMGAVYVKRGTRQRLAEKYGVGVHVIKDILGGRCWGTP